VSDVLDLTWYSLVKPTRERIQILGDLQRKSKSIAGNG